MNVNAYINLNENVNVFISIHSYKIELHFTGKKFLIRVSYALEISCSYADTLVHNGHTAA